MNSSNTSREGKYNIWKANAKFPFIELISVALCLTGIILLCLHTETLGYEIIEDYTDCKNFNEPTTKCKDSLNNTKIPCYCYIHINISRPMDDNVTVFYELESYDQSRSNYYNSRDDKQLLGMLSLSPSESCDPYTYAETTEGKKPIAPCGAIADSMFNDTYSIQINDTYVPFILTGIISEADKAPYRNPPGNLELAFQNFSKPKNWVRNVWELDTNNPDNNGFQNEAFIAWMKTEWKRKPAWRVNRTGAYEHGMPPGDYILRVEYAYPPTRYDGRRKVIISSVHTIINPVKLGFGITLLLIGLLLFIGKLFYNRKVYNNYLQCELCTN